MKVLVLASSYPRTAHDHAGRFVATLNRRIAMRGHGVQVIAPGEDNRAFYGAGAPENIAKRPWLVAGVAKFACEAAFATRRSSFDLAMSHWLVPSGVVGAMVAKRHVAIAHSADVRALERLPAAVARFVAERAQVIWFVSRAHRDRVLSLVGERFRERCVVAPMPIEDLDGLLAIRRERRATKRVLAMGRLVPIKGFDRLIRACRGLEVVIAGEGPERARLMALASEHRVDLRLPGNVFGAAKIALFASCDVYAVTSREIDGRSEGVPVAMLEAMASGMPVVAIDSGGIGEVLGRESLVREEALRDALLGARHDSRQRAIALDAQTEAALATALGESARARPRTTASAAALRA